MKFCKNLQKVADISEPEWAPYWPNYKMLKKLIKELPSLVPSDENKVAAQRPLPRGEDSRTDSPVMSGSSAANLSRGQQHGDMTAEQSQRQEAEHDQERTSRPGGHDAGSIGKSPGEVAFFKLLHSEFRKAEHFFERAMEEFTIREERVREGMNIMKHPNSIMLNAKWSLMAKGIYRLYKDLLLLETFAIMAYCSFSKILKKHDKVTGYDTRMAFMTNIVNKANFTHYPDVLEMISRCERLYEDVTGNLLQEGQEGLYEDERLFISMIHRLNEQVLGSEGSKASSGRKDARPKLAPPKGSQSENESKATSSLRTLVEENEKKPFARKDHIGDSAQVSDHHVGDDEDSDDGDTKCSPLKKRKGDANETSASKKSRAA